MTKFGLLPDSWSRQEDQNISSHSCSTRGTVNNEAITVLIVENPLSCIYYTQRYITEGLAVLL